MFKGENRYMEQDKFYVLSANQSRKYKYLKKHGGSPDFLFISQIASLMLIFLQRGRTDF